MSVQPSQPLRRLFWCGRLWRLSTDDFGFVGVLLVRRPLHVCLPCLMT